MMKFIILVLAVALPCEAIAISNCSGNPWDCDTVRNGVYLVGFLVGAVVVVIVVRDQVPKLSRFICHVVCVAAAYFVYSVMPDPVVAIAVFATTEIWMAGVWSVADMVRGEGIARGFWVFGEDFWSGH